MSFCSTYAFADEGNDDGDSKQAWVVGANVHAGFLLNHHNNVRILNETHPYAMEVFAARSTNGTKAWHSFFNYPEYGVSYVLYNMGSPTYLGFAHGISPYMSFFLFDRAKPVNMNIKVGSGIAYVEKKFDRITNYKNASVGSHINAFINLQANLNVQVSDKLSTRVGLAVIHMSNGSFQKPNAGLNLVSAFVGANYLLSEQQRMPKPPQELFEKRWEYRLFLSGGLKEIYPIGSPKYVQTGLSLEVSKPHLAFTRFGGTLDVFYSFSDYPSLRNEGVEVTRLQTTKLGLTAGYELLFGRLSANFQAGAYLYAKNKQEGVMYQRLALRYAATNRLKIHLGLKTQLGQADYIEFGLGYRIR